MSFSIGLSSSPQFSPSASPPAIQDWSFSVESPKEFYFYPGDPFPPDVVIDIQVRDYPQIAANLGLNFFDSFIIKSYPAFNTTPPFFGRTTNIDFNGSDLSTSLNYQETYFFQNLNSLIPILNFSYDITINYEVYGVTASGTEVLQETKQRIIRLYYITGNEVQIATPSPLTFTHIVGQPLPPAQTVVIEADTNYQIGVNEKFDATGNGLSGVITTVNGLKKYNATGRIELQIQPNSDIEQITDEIITEKFVQVEKVIYDDDGFVDEILTQHIDVKYIALSSGSAIIDPPALSFFLIKDFDNNTTTQSFNVMAVDASTLSSPNWVTLSESSLSGPGTIEATIPSANNFDVGIYEDVITIDFGSSSIDVPVTVEVVENIRLNLLENGLNFTLENTKFTELFSGDNNADAKINLQVDQIGYQLTEPDTLSFEYKTGFFDNRSKIHIGEIVERSLKSIDIDDVMAVTDQLNLFDQANRTIVNYYKPALVNLDLEILSPADQSVLSSEAFNFLKFVAGRKPDIKINLAFLRYDRVVQRVTRFSKILFNYLTLGNQSIYFYHNQNQIASVNVDSADYQLHAMLIKFDGFKPGDKLLISTDSDHFGISFLRPLTEEYIVMPECEHQNTILFEDEYKTLRAFDFTGEWRYTSNYERFTSSTYKNLVETITLDDTVKQQSLNIHTGYVPRDHQIIVDQIKRAKKAWLLDNNNNSVVELVPNNEEHLNYDSDNDLYNYEMNFIINKKHDLQNYS